MATVEMITEAEDTELLATVDKIYKAIDPKTPVFIALSAITAVAISVARFAGMREEEFISMVHKAWYGNSN